MSGFYDGFGDLRRRVQERLVHNASQIGRPRNGQPQRLPDLRPKPRPPNPGRSEPAPERARERPGLFPPGNMVSPEEFRRIMTEPPPNNRTGLPPR